MFPFFNWSYSLHQGLGRSLPLFLPRPLSLGLVQSNHLARYTRYIECTRLCSTQHLGAAAGEFPRTTPCTCQWQSEWSCTLAEGGAYFWWRWWRFFIVLPEVQGNVVKKKGGQASFMLLPPMAIKCRSCFLAVSLSWWTVCLWWGWCPILESEFDFPSVDRKNRWKEDKGRSSRCYSDVIWNCCTFHSRPPLYGLEANPKHVSTSHATSYMHVTFAYDSDIYYIIRFQKLYRLTLLRHLPGTRLPPTPPWTPRWCAWFYVSCGARSWRNSRSCGSGGSERCKAGDSWNLCCSLSLEKGSWKGLPFHQNWIET